MSKPKVWILSNWAPALAQNNEFLPRNVVFLDSFADDTLRLAIGVIIRGVPSV